MPAQLTFSDLTYTEPFSSLNNCSVLPRAISNILSFGRRRTTDSIT